jgi:hypothetical protein
MFNKADANGNRLLRIEILVYVLAILAVNIIFIYLRSSALGKEIRLVTYGYIFFGTLQLIYVVPKIMSNISQIKKNSNDDK